MKIRVTHEYDTVMVSTVHHMLSLDGWEQQVLNRAFRHGAVRVTLEKPSGDKVIYEVES